MERFDKMYKILLIPLLALVLGVSLFLFFTSKNDSTSEYVRPFTYSNTKVDAENTPDNSSVFSQSQLFKIDPNDRFFTSIKLAEEIFTKLNLNKTGETAWEDTSYKVSFDEASHIMSIDFKNSLSQKNFEFEEVNNLSIDTLKKLDLWPYEGREYDTDTRKLESVSLDGTAYMTGFSELIFGLPVYTDLELNSQIFVQIDIDGRVKQIKYKYTPYILETAELAFKSNRELSESIASGNFLISEGSVKNGEKIILEEITGAYIVATNNSYLQPVYILRGKNPSNQVLEIWTLALREVYFVN